MNGLRVLYSTRIYAVRVAIDGGEVTAPLEREYVVTSSASLDEVTQKTVRVVRDMAFIDADDTPIEGALMGFIGTHITLGRCLGALVGEILA